MGIKMEKAAEELDAKFHDTEKRLDLVTWKVDQLTSLPTECGETLTTSRLLSSLQEVRAEFKTVVGEVEQLKKDQQTAMTSILAEIQTAMNSSDTLKQKLNMPKEADNSRQ